MGERWIYCCHPKSTLARLRPRSAKGATVSSEFSQTSLRFRGQGDGVQNLSFNSGSNTLETALHQAVPYDTRMTVTGKTAKMLRKLLERVKGIEPSSQAWEAHILPLNHTRTGKTNWVKIIAEGRGRNGGVGPAQGGEQRATGAIQLGRKRRPVNPNRSTSTDQPTNPTTPNRPDLN